MIELAPENKRGLALAGPLILAGGGYGAEYSRETLQLAHALVTRPTSLRARVPGPRSPRIANFSGGALVAPDMNPGLAAVLASQRHSWDKLGLPVIFSLAAFDLRHWEQILRRIRRFSAIVGLELEIDEEMEAKDAVHLARAEWDLPVLARVPMTGVLEMAEAALQAGADALTVGIAPLGRVGDGFLWEGRLTGSALLPLAVQAVLQVSTRFPDARIVGAGGVQSAADVRAFLSAGAVAVQIDSILWRDPQALDKIAGAFDSG